ncbi:hypothetical protein O6H91_06G025600 [Diphasiastrum complanatum]|uniref:Uncharacterized protein n=3 Tax=Diphasiastrum complanatum TaxID=34168 RepID=A0ACC2DBL9_DIPCM|nr:hypothetical protein O6H91_06G025600 [Diphasiastrum complanatum]KAJ7551714.1 hypothetical protein O6H91_06G025600 [Diphasiastrum complanatum]KAJ7551715.1 hypothetical protein O6H91_06G025600 [Diphasiastrum complanatum]
METLCSRSNILGPSGGISFPNNSCQQSTVRRFNGLRSPQLPVTLQQSSGNAISLSERFHLPCGGGKVVAVPRSRWHPTIKAVISFPVDERSSSANKSDFNRTDSETTGLTTLSAQITRQTEHVFPSDPDHPSEGFSSIHEAVEAIRQGKCVVVVDDEDRENEGDLIMAGSLVTPEAIAFIVRHCTGIICCSMKGEDLDRLRIPLMVQDRDNEEALLTAFAVTVDAKVGTTTGVSARDRAKTILALSSLDSKPEHFRRPGHIFPLRYKEGGVLKRAGHTEASLDLTVLAGLPPVGVLCELVNDEDGSMSRLPTLRDFAKKHGLPIISIADLVRYRRKRETLVERTAVARLPTEWGTFKAYSYKSKLDGIEHMAMVMGDIGDGLDVLVRVHSECLTGDIFSSFRCDCGNQLALAMQRIAKAGRGVLVYLRGHEGRGIGLGHKLRAYNLQDLGRDTVEANVELGLPIDSREYGIGAQILRDVGVRRMKLMTNNPSKYLGLKGYGLAVTGRIPVISPVNGENRRYLETKRSKMGHVYESDLPGSFAGLRIPGSAGGEMESLG